jgi:hypothetical protein
MEKEENITGRKRRTAIHLARAPLAGNDFDDPFVPYRVDRAALWIAVDYDDLGRVVTIPGTEMGDDFIDSSGLVQNGQDY